MGHSSLDSTMRYVQPSEEDLQKVVERLGEAGLDRARRLDIFKQTLCDAGCLFLMLISQRCDYFLYWKL